MKRAWLCLMFVLLVVSCGNKKSTFKSYYFPYAEFTTAKVYKYVNVKDTTQLMYWRFETGSQNGDTVMSTGIYNTNLTLRSVFHNKITDEGAQLQSMMLNGSDSVMLINCEISNNESFKWAYNKNEPWLLSFGFKNPDKITSQDILSERNVEKQHQKVVINNQSYDCIVIKESTIFNEISNNTTRSEEQQRTSYFAYGVGLVKFETFNANGSSEIYELKEVIIDKDKKVIPPIINDSLKATE